MLYAGKTVEVHISACAAAQNWRFNPFFLQVEHAALLRLVKKSPAMLKLNSGKLQQHIALLAELGGLSPQQVYKVYVAWPVLTTTSIALLKAR
jgi:hypothetical protein